MLYRIRPTTKRHREFLDLFKTLRARWPGQKLYIVADNFSPHHQPTVRAWAAATFPDGPLASRNGNADVDHLPSAMPGGQYGFQ